MLTGNVVLTRDWPGSHDKTEGVEVPRDPEVLLPSTLAREGKVRHHYLLLRPWNREEVASLGLLRGKLVEVADLLDSEILLKQLPSQDVHPRQYLVGVLVQLA